MRKHCLNDDSGNVTITAAGTIAALISLVLLVAVLAKGMIHTHRAQVAAELSAVAAAHALYRGEDPCAVADQVARRNAGERASCDVVDEDVLVAVRVGGKEVTARAGPLG